jgi:hypothetical protein
VRKTDIGLEEQKRRTKKVVKQMKNLQFVYSRPAAVEDRDEQLNPSACQAVSKMFQKGDVQNEVLVQQFNSNPKK